MNRAEAVIDASNLRVGGGVQVASSFITEVATRSDTAGQLVEGLGLTRSQQRPDDVAVLMLRRRLSHALRTS